MVLKASRQALIPLLAIVSGLAPLIGCARVSSPSSPVPPPEPPARPREPVEAPAGRTAIVITSGGSAESSVQPPIQMRSAEWPAIGPGTTAGQARRAALDPRRRRLARPSRDPLSETVARDANEQRPRAVRQHPRLPRLGVQATVSRRDIAYRSVAPLDAKTALPRYLDQLERLDAE